MQHDSDHHYFHEEPDMGQFTKYPKTSRLFRNVVITEKIDGITEAIHIEPVDES